MKTFSAQFSILNMMQQFKAAFGQQDYSGLEESEIKWVIFLTRSVFLEYLLIGTSYGSDFCMSVKI